MKKYRIVKRGDNYFVQEKFLGFLFWTDQGVHPEYGFSFGYKTLKEAEVQVDYLLNGHKETVIKYF